MAKDVEPRPHRNGARMIFSRAHLAEGHHRSRYRRLRPTVDAPALWLAPYRTPQRDAPAWCCASTEAASAVRRTHLHAARLHQSARVANRQTPIEQTRKRRTDDAARGHHRFARPFHSSPLPQAALVETQATRRSTSPGLTRPCPASGLTSLEIATSARPGLVASFPRIGNRLSHHSHHRCAGTWRSVG